MGSLWASDGDRGVGPRGETRCGRGEVRAVEPRVGCSPHARQSSCRAAAGHRKPSPPKRRRFRGPGSGASLVRDRTAGGDGAHPDFATPCRRPDVSAPPQRTRLAPTAAVSAPAAATPAAATAALVVLRCRIRFLRRRLLGRRHGLKLVLKYGRRGVVHSEAGQTPSSGCGRVGCEARRISHCWFDSSTLYSAHAAKTTPSPPARPRPLEGGERTIAAPGSAQRVLSHLH